MNVELVTRARDGDQDAFRELVEPYRRELQLHPKEFKAAFNLSRLYERLGNRKGEIDALRESVAANDAFAEGYLYLARACLNGGDLDEAAAMARKGLDLDPRSRQAPLGHYVLADVFSKRGRLAEAQRELAAGRAAEARARP